MSTTAGATPSYVNCPACELSLDTRHFRGEDCPRCLKRAGRRVPLFASPLTYRALTGSMLGAAGTGRS